MDHRQFVLDHIREINDFLHLQYGTPDHNNKKDPLDELIFILISRRTRRNSYESVFNRMKTNYPGWGKVASLSDKRLMRMIGGAGLGSKRVPEIKELLNTIKVRFGEYSLDSMRNWPNNRIFNFLTSLNGIGPKSAFCVMMYSLGKKVFPVDTHVNRICQRMGLIPQGTNHKVAQHLLASVFPETLRYSLHVNMVSHGRRVCRSGNPSCGLCIVKGFCAFPRSSYHESNKPQIIDLFAGPGGMSLGFERAGFQLKSAIEYNKYAADTLLYNRSYLPANRIIRKDIRTLGTDQFRGAPVDVIVAGPPCQEYSPVRQNSDRNLGRKELYRHVLRFTQELKPTFVVVENVPGMASETNMKYVNRVRNGLKRIGYEVSYDFLNARDYGIPQNRKRIFFIARRRTGNSRNKTSKSLDRIWTKLRKWSLKKEVTFIDAVKDLPPIKAGEGTNFLMNKRVGGRSLYSRSIGDNSGIIFNHVARKHNPRDLKAFKLLNEGENALDLHRKNPDLMPYSTSNFDTKFYKIRRNLPSPTIVAHLRKDANSFVHPIYHRGITPREAARLQSFPDTYLFLGTMGIQFEQIGNAVPPILAEKIAQAMLSEI